MVVQMPKSEWGPGPWQFEPDRVEWRRHGLPCLIIRGPHGALCGYVAIPPGHPLHGMSHDDEEMPELTVHGGLSYSDSCEGGICHEPQPGEPADVWWFGFDTAHSDDFCPRIAATLEALSCEPPFDDPDEAYRDLAYVTHEVNNLADQLRDWRDGHA